ncbi:IS3 family transposase [Bradyrhizobium genosp. A]|uniref:IS3 family transposase n=1 Tax=Bradyrhizobium genosp. A TaxID=83626 RepID=UPI003CF1A40D
MLDRADQALSIRRQCVFLGIARSGVDRPANDNDLAVMRGPSTSRSPPGRAMLKVKGLQVNRKRVQRLMRKMGIAAGTAGSQSVAQHDDRPAQPKCGRQTSRICRSGAAYLVAGAVLI